jgi:hypothetical protein
MSDSMAGQADRDGRRDPEPQRDQDPGLLRTTEFHEPPETGPAAGARPLEPAAPRALGVERTPTGDAGVDEQLTRLADADHLTADGHVEVYEDVHSGLRDALSALDARQGPQGPSVPPATSLAHDHNRS